MRKELQEDKGNSKKWNAMQDFNTKTQWLLYVPPPVALKICLNFAHGAAYLWVLYE